MTLTTDAQARNVALLLNEGDRRTLESLVTRLTPEARAALVREVAATPTYVVCVESCAHTGCQGPCTKPMSHVMLGPRHASHSCSAVCETLIAWAAEPEGTTQ